MTSSSTVLILGAGGRLGAACAKAFAGAGWRVIAQTRKTPTAQWPDGVTALVTGDTPIKQFTAKLQNIDVVVHAMNPAYTNAAWTAQVPAMMTLAIEVARS